MELPGTGVHAVDAGHERVMALLEKLRYNPANLQAVIKELSVHLQAHFSEEEGLMKSARYRGAKAHVAEHGALAGILVGDLPDDVARATSYEEILAIVDHARQAFLDHILGLDHALALHLMRKQQRDARATNKAGTRAAKPRIAAGKA